MQVILETERLFLRKMTMEDLDSCKKDAICFSKACFESFR